MLQYLSISFIEYQIMATPSILKGSYAIFTTAQILSPFNVSGVIKHGLLKFHEISIIYR